MTTDPATSPDYEIVPVRGTESSLIRLIRRDIRDADDPLPEGDDARAAWLYAKTPEGPATILAMRVRDGSWIGMVAIVPRRIYMDGHSFIGAFLCDFYVHPRHRKILPALELQRYAKQHLSDLGIANYAIPNGRSLPIFRRLGSSHVMQRMRWARPIRFWKFLSRRQIALAKIVGSVFDASAFAFDHLRSAAAVKIRSEWLSGIDERFDALWTSVPTTGAFIGDRSSAYLRWRFLDEPGHDNRVLGFFRSGSTRLAGYLIGEIVQREFVVRDLLFSPDAAVDGILARAMTSIRELNVDGIGLRAIGEPRLAASLHRLGFRTRDPDTIFVRASFETACANWYFTNADEDV